MTSIIAPRSFILNAIDPDRAVDVYEEIKLTKNLLYECAINQYGTDDTIIIEDYIMDAILLYIRRGGFADIPLHQYLDKLNSPDDA